MNKFQIRVIGSYEKVQDFEKIIVSWGIPSGAKVGPRVHVVRDGSSPELWHTIANEVSGELICQKTGVLEKYWRANQNVALRISAQPTDYLFDFADAPLHKLKEFLKNPRLWIFPPLDILTDGCKKSFDNALDLIASAENLLEQQNILKHHVAFLLVEAFEEFGKGHLILEKGKDAMKAGKEAVAMSSFRSHYKKFDEASKQLVGNIYRGKKGAFKLIIEHLQASGKSRALDLQAAIPEISMRMESPSNVFQGPILTSLRHPGEHYREQTLYLNYVGSSKSWLNPQTQLSEGLLRALAGLLKISCKVMIDEINAKKEIDKVRDIQQVLTTPDFSLPSDC